MVDTNHGVEFVGIRDVLDRYHLPGPHATVVMPVPPPGATDGDLHSRWRALRNNLRRDGATDAMLEHLDGAVATVPPHGETVLLTAAASSAAWCLLSSWVTGSTWHVGRVPWLIPALATLDAREPAVGAIIDRVGADLVILSARGAEPAGEVTGDDEFVHKTTRGGWSQPRHQRHSEVIWNRNAHLVGTALADLGEQRSAGLALITGDERAVGLVAHRLDQAHEIEAITVERGGRHEPDTATRLHSAAMEMMQQRHATRVRDQLERLNEELAQQDRAIDGVLMTLEAISEDRVATLFVDPEEAQYPLFDVAAMDALDHGAQVVVVPGLERRDGIAARLRFPYR